MPLSHKESKTTKYILPKGYILKVGDFPAELLHEAIIQSGTKLPLEVTNDTEKAMLERLIDRESKTFKEEV